MPNAARTFSHHRLLYGGDYNPEQWPEEVWAQDVELMRRAGVNAATVGVFSWARLEPEEGVYDFGWLDRVVSMLHDGGIGIVLATPTASPPPWFSRAHPDALPVGPDGTRLTHGSRDTYAVTAPAYREACRRIVQQLVDRYGSHPGLLAWHLHNEYGTYDWGEHTAAAFRRWLRDRYASLEELNRAWYTSFWSQHYRSWEDILPPRATQYLHNPTQVVDFRRFMSDEMLAAMCEQRDIIRAAGSAAPVTTNFMLPTWNHIEQWSWSDALDVLSVDHYLDSEGPDGETHAAYAGDLVRSWSHGEPWLLMEQSTINMTMPQRRPHKDINRVIRNSLSYIARGSQGALFFQWRAPAAGSEVWHGGMVPHAGEDSRTYRGFVELGRILRDIAEVAAPPDDGPVVAADVAVMWHAEGWWALETKHLPNDRMDYASLVRGTHRALWHARIPADFVAPDGALDTYKLVLVPSMFPMDDAAVATLERYVDAGGRVCVWPFTGVADENMHVVAGGYPGRIRSLLGVRSEEFHPLGPDETVPLSDGTTGELWSEYLSLDGAEVTSSYAGGPLRGSPATTRHRYGSGTAYYLSTVPDPASVRGVLERLCDDAGVQRPLGVRPPADVEVVVRRGANADYVFVLNHGDTPVEVTGPGEDLVTSTTTTGGLTVAPGGYAVVRTDDTTPEAGWRLD
ncbi:beta-galactosidase [Phytoactinopolyspora halotolerans]|uniref:beta-galactosidase n=1 Tax=Phytoactinopolyspora halotolerans TaxID=1981512 RepID=UPI001C206B4A|nr:beta-galactosidase [Phytoactinopolyspora halotolerans]